MSGIYIHIPFCKQACSYCDFYFTTRQAQKEEFVQSLIQEIESKKGSRVTEEPVQTIYFGGGTPSLLEVRQIEAIINAISRTFHLDLKEITLEMNPDDVKPEFLRGVRSAGVNRASMGVQTFDADLLRFMNRVHTSEEALGCLKMLERSDFEVFTVDLIYGNPGQSTEVLEKDIKTILSFNPPHISAYSLTIEPRTRLGRQVKLGRLLPPEDDVVATHYDLVVELLQSAGIEQYEVSNYAKPGKEAVHNSSYWKHENYIGFGPSAHSFWWDEEYKKARRWSNAPRMENYLNGEWEQTVDSELLDLPELAEERLMLGLRTRNGISVKELEENYRYNFNENQQAYLKKVADQKKALINDNIRLTRDGLRIADAILLDLLTV